MRSSTPGVARRSSRPVYAPCQGCSVMIYSNGFHHTRHGQAELHWTPQHRAVRGVTQQVHVVQYCSQLVRCSTLTARPYPAREMSRVLTRDQHTDTCTTKQTIALALRQENPAARRSAERHEAAVSRVTLRRVSRPVCLLVLVPQATKAAYLSTDTTFLSWAKQRRKRDGATAIAGPPTLPPSGGRAASVLKGC